MESPSPCAAKLLRTETQQWSQEPPACLPRDRVRPWARGQLPAQLQAQYQGQPQGQLQWEPQGEFLPPAQLQGQYQAPAQLLQPGQLPDAAVWASTIWVDRPDFLGIGPIPVPGLSPAIPHYQPSYGPAAWGWHPAFYTGAGGVSCY